MLARTWRKGNAPTPLVGMKIGVDTVENSVEISQLEMEPAIPLLGILKKFFLNPKH